MKRKTLKTSLAILSAACIVCAGPAVLADWFPGTVTRCIIHNFPTQRAGTSKLVLISRPA